MNRREKIITGLALAAVLYGGYALLTGGSGPENRQGKTGDLAGFVAQVSERTGKNRLSEAELHTILKAAEPWKENPFLRGRERDFMSAASEDTGPRDGKKEGAFVYSGYIEIAGKKIAIINGVEYEAGDKLEEEGYVLRKILPTKVVLYNGKYEKSYPLNEDD